MLIEPVATSLYISTLPSVIYNGFGTGAQQIDPRTIPFLFGGQLPLNIYLMEPVDNPPPSTFPYNIIPTFGLQLFFYITDGTIGGTIYTQQINWATDANNTYFIANLPMNTANLQALLGTSKSPQPAFLQVAYIQNGQQCPVCNFPILIGVGTPIVNLQVPAGLTPLSAEVANATFVPKQPVAGQGIQLMSKGGKIIELIYDDNLDGSATLQFMKLN